MKNTKIEWTQDSWNPLRGCSRVSDGCRNCYAEQVAGRFSGPGQPYEGLITRTQKGPTWNGQIKLVPEKLSEPLRWKKPRMIFVNSMSDLFHENVPDEYIDQVFAVMAMAGQNTYQVLTKRPGRMLRYMADAERRSDIELSITLTYGNGKERAALSEWPLSNVWLGVSIENQATADERIPLLLQTPATVRWISAEPLLGPVDLTGEYLSLKCDGSYPFPGLARVYRTKIIDLLDWVVVGGESGPNARPMHPDWARSLRDQCQDAGVPFFFKQWGEWTTDDWGERPGLRDSAGVLPSGEFALVSEGYSPPFDDGDRLKAAGNVRLDGRTMMDRVGKKAAGRLLDGVLHDAYPGASA